MLSKKMVVLLAYGFVFSFLQVSHAFEEKGCPVDWQPVISFEEFQISDIEQKPPEEITVKGKLKLPVACQSRKKRFIPKKNLPAVVILHGSGGVDSRGDFYARALNAAGIATFEIDMWEARGINSAADRPSLPFFNCPDAFGALKFLSEHSNIDPDRIGVLGFSWGGVVTMASATKHYAEQFGGDLRFAAHVAHYPVCYAYSPDSSIPGLKFSHLTGSPILIQIGEEDDYDNGSEPCFALKDSLDSEEQPLLEVIAYEGAFHGWDRLEVPIKITDSFSNLGRDGEVEIIPDVDQAYKSRRNVVRFFLQNL
jgi:dienelactone hydrolase